MSRHERPLERMARSEAGTAVERRAALEEEARTVPAATGAEEGGGS